MNNAEVAAFSGINEYHLDRLRKAAQVVWLWRFGVVGGHIGLSPDDSWLEETTSRLQMVFDGRDAGLSLMEASVYSRALDIMNVAH